MFDYDKLWTLLSLQTASLLIPSVSFIFIFRNSVIGGRRNGVLTALGLCFAIFCYVAFSIASAAVITESSLVFSIIKYVGGLYLIWMGFSFWRDSATFSTELEDSLSSSSSLDETKKRSGFDALKAGFMVNILNPYILLFHFGTFSTVIPRTVPLGHKAIYAISLTILSFLGFIFLSLIFTYKPVREFLRNHRQWTENVTTLLLIFLGCRILFYWGFLHDFQEKEAIKIIRMGSHSAPIKKHQM